MKIISKLNNIFDQYNVEENRVTNSFLQVLAHEGLLLERFLLLFDIKLKQNSEIVISCQKQPFSIGDSIDTKEIDSVPDGWIIVDDSVAIVFEVKVAENAIKMSQLRSHLRKIRGYDKKFLCVITPDDKNPVINILDDVVPTWVSWRQIYDLVVSLNIDKKNISGYLVSELKEFLLMKEDLVGFQGVNYTDDIYNTHDARNILKSLMKEIRPEVQKSYPLLCSVRRSLNTDADNVWSYLSLDGDFTLDIHMTIWLYRTYLGIGMTIPNNAKKRKKRLRNIFQNDDLFREFLDKVFMLRTKTPHLYFEFVHRHYLQRRNDIMDGIMEFDVDTIQAKEKGVVKLNPAWLAGLRQIICNEGNYVYNGQLMIRTKFFYKDHPKIKTADFKEKIVKTINSFNDTYQFLLVE